MFEQTFDETAGLILARNQEALYAAQAPQMIARRELELLQDAERPSRRPRLTLGRILARARAGLGGRAGTPAVTSR
jgi:hypothetical protein